MKIDSIPYRSSDREYRPQPNNLAHDDQVFADLHGGIHPTTGLPIECGSGCLPIWQQVAAHLKVIQQRDGKAAADLIYAKLSDALRTKLRETNNWHPDLEVD
jgi:hypothetical protein